MYSSFSSSSFRTLVLLISALGFGSFIVIIIDHSVASISTVYPCGTTTLFVEIPHLFRSEACVVCLVPIFFWAVDLFDNIAELAGSTVLYGTVHLVDEL